MTDPLNTSRSLPRRRYGNGRRALYGSLWSFYTLLFAIGSIGLLSAGNVGVGFLGIAFALLMGIYAYRIWTWRARHLWLLIFF